MESFYGGRKGTPFVIAQHFDSFNDMVECFRQGAVTTSEVGYGEYVIIDTIVNLKDYSNPNNGQIYRRGMNYQNNYGGAEYVGQIVGPEGETPTIKLDALRDITGDANFGKTGYQSGKEYYTVDNGSLVSGKNTNQITCAWLETKDDNGKTQGAKLGFVFPYPVFDTKVEFVDSIDESGIERTDDNSKVFYYEWTFKIPKVTNPAEAAIISEDSGNGTPVNDTLANDGLWFVLETSDSAR